MCIIEFCLNRSVAAQANVTEKLMEHEMAAKKSDESISNRSLTQFFAVASAVLQAVNSLHVETEARNAFVSSCVFERTNISLFHAVDFAV